MGAEPSLKDLTKKISGLRSINRFTGFSDGCISLLRLPRSVHAKLLRTVMPYDQKKEVVVPDYGDEVEYNPQWTYLRAQISASDRGYCCVVFRGSRMAVDDPEVWRSNYQLLERPWKIADDLLQPIWGVVHLLTAAAYVVALPVRLLERSIRYFTVPEQEEYLAMTNLKIHLIKSLIWLIYAIQNVLCGAIELVTTPLTYFYRMPLRLLLTAAGENNQSTGLTVGSALLVTGGMTLALWTGFAHFFPTLAGAAQQAINDLGAQAMPIIQQSLLGMAAAGAAIALMSLATTHCKKQSASDEGQGEGSSAGSSPLLTSGSH